MSLEIYMDLCSAALTGLLANEGRKGTPDEVADAACTVARAAYILGYARFNSKHADWMKRIKDYCDSQRTANEGEGVLCPACNIKAVYLVSSGGGRCRNCNAYYPVATAEAQAKVPETTPAANPDDGRVSISKEKVRSAVKMLDQIKVAVQATWAGHGAVSDVHEMANSAIDNLKGGLTD